MNDELFMSRALALAQKGMGRTSPNPMVGAVLVKGRRIIAEGWHRRCGADHAEVVAMKKAGKKVHGATLYLTLEPCHHTGRTPPCVDHIIAQKIKKVVVAMRDPNPLTNGKSIRKLQRAGITVRTGVRQKEAARLNEVFVKNITTGLPFVTAKMAQTMDGKIATAKGESKWITSERTRKFARKQRDAFDAILAGVSTVIKDDPRLSGTSRGKRLKKIVLDSMLRTPLTAKFLKGAAADCIIATTKKASAVKAARFKAKGAKVIVCPEAPDGVDLRFLFKELAKREITSILIEGGAHTVGSALKKGLVDKMHVYVAPKIIGDRRALSSVAGIKVGKLRRAIPLKDPEVKALQDDIFIQAYV